MWNWSWSSGMSEALMRVCRVMGGGSARVKEGVHEWVILAGEEDT